MMYLLQRQETLQTWLLAFAILMVFLNLVSVARDLSLILL
jgi:hypothetical protein